MSEPDSNSRGTGEKKVENRKITPQSKALDLDSPQIRGKIFEWMGVEEWIPKLKQEGLTEFYANPVREGPQKGKLPRGTQEFRGWVAKAFPHMTARPDLIAIDHSKKIILVGDITKDPASSTDIKPGGVRKIPHRTSGEAEMRHHFEKTIENAEQIARNLPDNFKDYEVVAQDRYSESGVKQSRRVTVYRNGNFTRPSTRGNAPVSTKESANKKRGEGKGGGKEKTKGTSPKAKPKTQPQLSSGKPSQSSRGAINGKPTEQARAKENNATAPPEPSPNPPEGPLEKAPRGKGKKPPSRTVGRRGRPGIDKAMKGIKKALFVHSLSQLRTLEDTAKFVGQIIFDRILDEISIVISNIFNISGDILFAVDIITSHWQKQLQKHINNSINKSWENNVAPHITGMIKQIYEIDEGMSPNKMTSGKTVHSVYLIVPWRLVMNVETEEQGSLSDKSGAVVIYLMKGLNFVETFHELEFDIPHHWIISSNKPYHHPEDGRRRTREVNGVTQHVYYYWASVLVKDSEVSKMIDDLIDAREESKNDIGDLKTMLNAMKNSNEPILLGNAIEEYIMKYKYISARGLLEKLIELLSDKYRFAEPWKEYFKAMSLSIKCGKWNDLFWNQYQRLNEEQKQLFKTLFPDYPIEEIISNLKKKESEKRARELLEKYEHPPGGVKRLDY